MRRSPISVRARHTPALTRLRFGKDMDLQKPTHDLGLPSGVAFNLSAAGRKKTEGDQAPARLASGCTASPRSSPPTSTS
ncbi:MAG: hypothetical protein OXE50_08045 [Chloroflexi bacterium]|nr:hypothetical protein [Chloroflexota bacterium]